MSRLEDLERLRKARGVSWRALGQLTGVSWSTLHSAVIRSARCSESLLDRIERALRDPDAVSPVEAFDRDPDPDSIEWRAALEAADRRFCRAMATQPMDFAGRRKAA